MLQYHHNQTYVFREPVGTVAFMGGTWAVPPEFVRCYGKLIAHAYENLLQPNQFIHLDDCPVSYHSAARNALAAKFMGDWLLTLDTDHEFEPDILARMLGLVKAWDVDVLTAVYRYKAPPYLPNLFWWNEERGTFVQIAEIDWKQPLQDIKCSGAGCLLVRRKVFDRIREELGEDPFEQLPSIANPKKNWSEDFSFYRRCMRLGIRTFVAPQIYSSHLRVTPVTDRDYDPSGISSEKIEITQGAQ